MTRASASEELLRGTIKTNATTLAKVDLVRLSDRFVKANYGQFAFVDPNSFDKEKENLYTITCGISPPYYVYEKGVEFPHLRFDINNKLAALELEVKDDQVIIQGVNEKKLVERLRNSESKKRSIVESSLLEAAKDKFTNIPLIRVSHNPLINLIRDMDRLVAGRIQLSKTEFRKWPKYFDLLKNLRIIQIDSESNISYGQNYKEMEKLLYNEEKGKEDLVNAVFSYVIRYGGAYIMSYLHITSIVPFLRSSTSYYYFSSAMRKLITMDNQILHENYRELYNVNPGFSNFEGWIEYLCKSDILAQEDGSIYGNAAIQEKLSDSLANYEFKSGFR